MSDPTIIAPLSGEIMSGTPGRTRARDGIGDVVDAEFTTVSREPARNPVSAPRSAPVGGFDILARTSNAPVRSRAGAGFWLCGVLASAAAFWMAGGHSLARHIPVPGMTGESPVQVASVTSQVKRSLQGVHLVIDGMLENTGADAAEAPDLDIEVAAVGGGVMRYRLGNGRALIEPRGARNFSSRLDAPATGVKSVSVTVTGDR